jgi:hypothetical protein
LKTFFPSRLAGWSLSFFDQWPDLEPLPNSGPRRVCSSCGIVDAEARPDRPERSRRIALTGAHRRQAFPPSIARNSDVRYQSKAVIGE